MKRIVAWFFLLVLILSLAACGSPDAPAEEPTSQQSASTVAEPPAEPPEELDVPEEVTSAVEPVSTADESTAADVAQFVEVSLPISEEPISFSIWYTWPPVLTNFIEGPGLSLIHIS